MESPLKESQLKWGIVKPCGIFGAEDILINNVCWLIRKFPVFPIP